MASAFTTQYIFWVRTIKLFFRYIFFVRKTCYERLLTTILSQIKKSSFTQISLPSVPKNVKVLRTSECFCLFNVHLVLESYFQVRLNIGLIGKVPQNKTRFRTKQKLLFLFCFQSSRTFYARANQYQIQSTFHSYNRNISWL